MAASRSRSLAKLRIRDTGRTATVRMADDGWIPPALRSLAALSAHLRSGDGRPRAVLAAAAVALSKLEGDRAAIWLISRDGTRMQLVVTSDGGGGVVDHGAWQPAAGPVSEVLDTRQPLEMGLVVDEVPDRRSQLSLLSTADEVGTARTAPGSGELAATGDDAPDEVGRFVPLWNRGRIRGVLGVIREAGRRSFDTEERISLDVIAERIEAAFALQDATDDLVIERGAMIEEVSGVLLREDLLTKLGSVG